MTAAAATAGAESGDAGSMPHALGGTMLAVDIPGELAPTGTLRASINLGNPVLAQGTAASPSGVTVDIARELGARLHVPVRLLCYDAARESFEAMKDGRADICFLAIDPARAETVAFTAPYAVIEGVFAVQAGGGRDGGAGHRAGHPDPGRERLHPGVPGRALAPGRQDLHYLRGHVGDPAHDHRQGRHRA